MPSEVIPVQASRRPLFSAPVCVTWDERPRVIAADLLKGSASEKPGAAGVLRRALQVLARLTKHFDPARHPQLR